MLLSDWRVLVRRWYVVVIGLPVTIALCWAMTVLVPVQFNLQAKVLLVPPKEMVDGKPVNPYMNLGGLDGTADVLSASLMDTVVADAMDKQGIAAEYETSRDQSVAGPVLMIDVKGDSREDAIKSQAFLLQQVPAILDRLQSSISVVSSAWIGSTVITREATPTVDRKGQIRALIVIGFLGIGGTYLTASLLDGHLMSRRRRPAGTARPLETSQRSPNLEQPQPVYHSQPPPQPAHPQPRPMRPQEAHPRPKQPQPAHPKPKPQQVHPESQPTQPNPQQRPLSGQRSDPWPL